ncbi:MAG: type II toxin-antitoxin system Phd/YefM family antitoxin [Gaiellaceae bacterium MAG52_C11]|nr:type II toxin-antitoxin system Phd/YefM family antitoxin [Candidatus Gaiellasilicea maunaloa]
MKNLTATELSRSLSSVLDAVQHRGESFEITRNGETVARLGPKKKATVGELLDFLRENPPDPDFARDVREARSFVVDQERDWPD